MFDDGIGEGGTHDQNESDSHVKNAEHFIAVDFPVYFEEIEDGWDFPGGSFDDGIDIIGKGAIYVSGNSPAGDMRHAGDDFFYGVFAEELDDWSWVESCRSEEDLAECFRFVQFGINLSQVEV